MDGTDQGDRTRANDLSPTINARQIAVIYMVILLISHALRFLKGAIVCNEMFIEWRILALVVYCLLQDPFEADLGSLSRQRMLQYYPYVKNTKMLYTVKCGVCWSVPVA